MRNIDRVILWGLPPTFCTLVQRAGRAVRDMTKDGEAILIVSSATRKKQSKALEDDVVAAAEELVMNSVDVTVGDQETAEEDDEGALSDVEDAREQVSAVAAQGNTAAGKRGRFFKSKVNYNSREAHYLVLYMKGDECRHKIWNAFFRNDQKRAHLVLS